MTSVLLVDDHQSVLNELHNLLDKQPDVNVAAEAKDGRQAVRLTRKLKPDVVIMDISMPNLNGIAATREIIDTVPNVKVIVLSAYSYKRFVEEALNAGASGYVLKERSYEELADAIKAAVTDRTYLSPSIAPTVAQNYVNR